MSRTIRNFDHLKVKNGERGESFRGRGKSYSKKYLRCFCDNCYACRTEIAKSKELLNKINRRKKQERVKALSIFEN